MATDKLKDLRERIRHSTAHVMADVVKQLYPDVKLAIGPPTEDGFYYDFMADIPFSEEDLEKIETAMQDMMSNTVNIQRLQKDVEKILSDIEKLKDKQRTFANGDVK